MEIEAGPLFAQLHSQAPPSAQPLVNELSELYQKKLWHELSLVIEQLLKDPQACSLIIPLYRGLIVPLGNRLSPDALARFSVIAASQLGQPTEAITLLLGIAQEYRETQPHLFVLARMSAALYQLTAGELETAKKAIDECEPLVEAFAGVDPAIKAAFYRVCAQYDKSKSAFSSYYKHALLYLAAASSSATASEEIEDPVGQCHDLCVAALLGETIYNFGELLMHPLLSDAAVLANPNVAALISALHAFNSGDHGRFDPLLPSLLASNPVLAPRADFLRQKMCLMALVECLSSSGATRHSRHLPFSEIADACRVPLTEVEFVLMKALSLGLFRGQIDEVAQNLTYTWVQPRVLDRTQMEGLRASIAAWKNRIAAVRENLHLGESLPTMEMSS